MFQPRAFLAGAPFFLQKVEMNILLCSLSFCKINSGRRRLYRRGLKGQYDTSVYFLFYSSRICEKGSKQKHVIKQAHPGASKSDPECQYWLGPFESVSHLFEFWVMKNKNKVHLCHINFLICVYIANSRPELIL